jgi:hypothetical protein
MTHHRATDLFSAQVVSTRVFSAQWTCAICRLDALPTQGPDAVAETELLASVHDRVHHGGARTAQILPGEPLAALYPVAS